MMFLGSSCWPLDDALMMADCLEHLDPGSGADMPFDSMMDTARLH